MIPINVRGDSASPRSGIIILIIFIDLNEVVGSLVPCKVLLMENFQHLGDYRVIQQFCLANFRRLVSYFLVNVCV